MSMKIKINCKKVYQTGIRYEQESIEMKKIQIRLKEILNSVNTAWSGEDSSDFITKLNQQISYLDNLIDFLNYKSVVLKDVAFNHNNADNTFLMNIRRSDICEK